MPKLELLEYDSTGQALYFVDGSGMNNAQPKPEELEITTTHLSTWQAARIAIARIYSGSDVDWIGFDAGGELVAGDGEPDGVAVMIASGEELHHVINRIGPEAVRWNDAGELVLLRSAEALAAIGGLAECFESRAGAMGADPDLYERTTSGWYGGMHRASRSGVHFATPSALDRVSGHIARGCPHCRRPDYVTPEAPESWDAVAAWQRRWESTDLSVEEAALWTDLVDCDPGLAMELRRSGWSVDRMRPFAEIWLVDNCENLRGLADNILDWVRSGFSPEEVEAWGPQYCGVHFLSIARDLRARGVGHLTAWNDIDVDGALVPIVDFLDSTETLGGRTVSYEERLNWLEQAGHVRSWATALR